MLVWLWKTEIIGNCREKPTILTMHPTARARRQVGLELRGPRFDPGLSIFRSASAFAA